MQQVSIAGSASTDTVQIEGVLADYPVIGRLPGGGFFATCTIRASGPVGSGPTAQNLSWPVIVHRAPSIELMKAAMPGDILELRAVVQEGRLLVPRSDGRVDVLLGS